MDDARITPELYGYTDRWDYRPGDTVALSLHAVTEQDAELALVRLHGADERVTAAGPLEEPVATLDPVRVGPQEVRPGSYAIANDLPGVTGLECWLCPTAPERAQGIAG